MNGAQIIENSKPFFKWIARWFDSLESISFDVLIPEPERAAFLSADLVVGFCAEGPLASPRINAVVPVTAKLFEEAHRRGVRRFVLAQDTHDPAAPEFGAWPPHCVRGTREANMVAALERLPFAADFKVIEKNALSAGMATDLEEWLSGNDDLRTFVVTGDCTDLCVYNLAMFVKMWADAHNLSDRRVVVDASAVQTYDLSVAAAAGGAFPHPGDFLHMMFLYHMALNGIRIVSRIT